MGNGGRARRARSADHRWGIYAEGRAHAAGHQGGPCGVMRTSHVEGYRSCKSNDRKDDWNDRRREEREAGAPQHPVGEPQVLQTLVRRSARSLHDGTRSD